MGILDLAKFVFGTETGMASAGVSIAKRLKLNGKYTEMCTELARHQYALQQARESKNKENKERHWNAAEHHLNKANTLRRELIPMIDWFRQTGEPIPIAEVIESIPRHDFQMPERRKWWQF